MQINNNINLIRLNNKRFFLLCLLCFVFVIISGFLSCFNTAQAATEIYFEKNNKENKESKEIFVGDIFSVDLKVSSIDQEINAIDGTVIYDKDKLEIKKVKTKDSVFSLWAEEPVFDNKTGKLSFVGGVPNGFSEKNGQILAVTFLAKKSGNSLVGFQDVFSVFANDGEGTVINPWLKPLPLDVQKKSFLADVDKNLLTYTTNSNNFFKYNIFVFILILLCIIIRLLVIKFWKRNKNRKKKINKYKHIEITNKRINKK